MGQIYRKGSVLQTSLLGAFGLLLLLSCNAQPEITPPVAPRIEHADTLHGDVRLDYYHWLRERDNPEVIAYLKAENEYTAAMMKHTEPLQKKLFEEMVARIKETDSSVPVKEDDYYYYTRTEEGKQYDIDARKKGSLDAPEEIILDENKLAEGYPFFSVENLQISPDHNLAAYAIDTSGREQYTIYIKDLSTGKLLPDVIKGVYYEIAWANDNKTFFYTRLDEALRPDRLYRHTLGTPPEDDQLIYTEDDDRYWMDIGRTKSKKYILLDLESETTSEWRYLSADDPLGEFKIIHPREENLEYSIDHHGDNFLIVTNDEAKNFKLMSVPTKSPAKKNWREVLPHRKNVKLDGIEVFKDFLVAYEREHGLRQISIQKLPDGDWRRVSFPEEVYTFGTQDNPDYNSKLLRFAYTSMVTPKSIYDYNMATQERELLKQDEVLGGYDPDQYESIRIYATATDGTQIPMSLVYRKGLVLDGNNPVYLRGYGAYGISSEPRFRSYAISLLDRGFVYAIAHVRGGGEMGRYWYEDGRLLKKKNTFTDFIACAERLIEQKYTSTERLTAAGGSAGGLLIGAVLNMRPDLFGAMVADVPFVDLINTMADPTIPLTVIEYDEWGNPADPEYYRYMLSYSPYDGVEAKDYPALLVTAGLNDPRVQYWEPAKWTAKLRSLKTDDNLLILKTNMGAGHMGASGRYDYLKEIAFEYAFLLDQLGIAR